MIWELFKEYSLPILMVVIVSRAIYIMVKKPQNSLSTVLTIVIVIIALIVLVTMITSRILR